MFGFHNKTVIALLAGWGSFLATGASSQPTLSVQRQGTNAVIQFTGRLQSASQVNGPYTNVVGAISPYVQPTIIGTNRFWRSRQTSAYRDAGGYARFAMGNGNSISLREDGTLWTWGNDESGQLGNGTSLNAEGPQPILTNMMWRVVAASAHAAAIREDGQLWLWGLNNHGQLGIGTFSLGPNYGESAPRAIATNHSWKAVATGQYFTLALREDGMLWSWGENYNGVLGIGMFSTNSPSPQPVMTNVTWRAISAGSSHALALRDDGTLWAWGLNSHGQLGDGTITNRNSPVRVFSNKTWAAISAGGYHSVALATDGTLWAWGHGTLGQLGDGREQNSSTPVRVGMNKSWTFVSARSFSTMAIATDGTLWAWGANFDGELGDRTWLRRSLPVQVATNESWIAATPGTMAVAANGTLWTWGDNDYGQLGRPVSRDRPIPLQIASNKTWLAASAGGGNQFSLAVASDGTMWQWGYQLSSVPIPLVTNKRWSLVRAGYFHNAAVASDGTLWAWGDNFYGQLGLGADIAAYSPTQTAAFKTWRTVSLGNFHTLALADDGTLWAWGANFYGEVGDGTYARRYLPVEVTPGKTWTSASAGVQHSMAVASDGTLWYWGSDLALHGTTNRYTRPLQIATSRTWRTVSAGGRPHGVATDGTLWALSPSVSQLATDMTWTTVSSSVVGHNLAVATDGSLWAWGSNQYGQLGDGTRIDRSSPVQVATNTTWTQVSAGPYFTLAVASDGMLWSWGFNNFGELGDGMTSIDPTRINGDIDWGPP